MGAVTATERQLYAIFDRSPIGMYRANERGEFHYANRALARMLGYEVTRRWGGAGGPGLVNLNSPACPRKSAYPAASPGWAGKVSTI